MSFNKSRERNGRGEKKDGEILGEEEESEIDEFLNSIFFPKPEKVIKIKEKKLLLF